MQSLVLISNFFCQSETVGAKEVKEFLEKKSRYYIYNSEPENIHYISFGKDGKEITVVFKDGHQHTCKIPDSVEVQEEVKSVNNGDVLLENDVLFFQETSGELIGLSWKNINMITVSDVKDKNQCELSVMFNSIGLSDLRKHKRFFVSYETVAGINKYCKVI